MNKAKARRSKRHQGMYAAQFMKTERNKARRATKRKARTVYWKAKKSA